MDIENLFPLVNIEVTGVPYPVMVHAVREACRNWAQKTWSIVETVQVSVQPDDDSYSLPLAEESSEVLGIKYVFNTEAKLELSPYGEVDKLKNYGTTGEPMWFEFDDELKLFPTPSKEVNLAVTVATRPTKTATTVSDKFLEHEEAIACFAKYKLMSMANQQWTNYDAAAVSYRQYKSLLSEAKLRELKGKTATNLVVTPRPFV